MSLLSTNDINKRFSGDKYFTLSYKDKMMENFILYCINRFNLGGKNIKKGDALKKMIFFLKKECTDNKVYLYMRYLVRHNMGYIPTAHQLQKNESIAYSFTIDKKVDELRKMIDGLNTLSLKDMSVLDIGTEKLEFLDRLGAQCKEAHGINIDTGFCHYDEHYVDNTKDKRFQLYDGKNIPHKDKSFDLVTMCSVIHHIPPSDLPIVAKEIARVCRGYLFIKDVDLIDNISVCTFELQHNLYEGVLMPGCKSYRNNKATMAITIKTLEDVGFTVMTTNVVPNFNRSYYSLLKI